MSGARDHQAAAGAAIRAKISTTSASTAAMTIAAPRYSCDAGALQHPHRRREHEGEDDGDRHRQQQRPGVLEQQHDGDEQQAAAEPRQSRMGRAAAAKRIQGEGHDGTADGAMKMSGSGEAPRGQAQDAAMASLRKDFFVAAPADRVWAALRDFGACTGGSRPASSRRRRWRATTSASSPSSTARRRARLWSAATTALRRLAYAIVGGRAAPLRRQLPKCWTQARAAAASSGPSMSCRTRSRPTSTT